VSSSFDCNNVICLLSELTCWRIQQVEGVKQSLYQGGSGDDVFQALVTLLSRLVAKHKESNSWGLKILSSLEQTTGDRSFQTPAGTQTEFAQSAYCLEELLSEPEFASHSPYIFLKTFACSTMERERGRRAIIREIRVCSTEQPDISHPNVCGISLATHAAAVEVMVPGFGWLGLYGRLPFVALEYCNGLDLSKFMAPKKMSALSVRLKQNLDGLYAKCPPLKKPRQEGDSETVCINQLLNAAVAYQEALARLFQRVYEILLPDPEDPQAKLVPTEYISAWSAKYDADVSTPAAAASRQVKAGRALRRFLELVHAEDWDRVQAFLQDLPPPARRADVPIEVQDLLLVASVATEHHEACRNLYRSMGKLLFDDPLCRSSVLDPRTEASYALLDAEADQQRVAALKYENTLFEHVFKEPREERLKMHAVAGEKAAITPPKVALVIFKQAADAIARLHSCGIVHGDIKAENFVLGDTGQVLSSATALVQNSHTSRHNGLHYRSEWNFNSRGTSIDSAGLKFNAFVRLSPMLSS
jgi:hypothetical protein